MSDAIREFLVTKFACAECGGPLNLSYTMPKGGAGYREGEPTGAAMVQQTVAVHPCSKCTAPAREVSAAVSTLMKHAAGVPASPHKAVDPKGTDGSCASCPIEPVKEKT
jgi:hypothetical protein